MLQRQLKLKNVIKFKRAFQIILFLNGQVFFPYMGQSFTSLNKLIIKPKYDFWLH